MTRGGKSRQNSLNAERVVYRRGARASALKKRQWKIAFYDKISTLIKKTRKPVAAACRDLAKLFDASPETLRALYRRMRKSGGRPHGRDLLSPEDEDLLCATAEAFSLSNCLLSRSMLCDIVKAYLPKLEGKRLNGWVSRFLRRHKGRLLLSKSKPVDSKRLAPATQCSVRHWVKFFPRYFTAHHLSAQWMVNTDETRLLFNGRTVRFVALEARGKGSRGPIKTPPGKVASYLPFVAANGHFIMDVFIIPLTVGERADFYLESMSRYKGLMHPTFYCFTQSGYLNGELWKPIMKKFKKEMARVAPGIHPVLLVDNATPHKVLDSLMWCVKNHIHLLYLPAHCTHFLQPLDNAIFEQFKNFILQYLNKKLSTLQPISGQLTHLMFLVAQAARRCLTKRVISRAFAQVGIFPWKPDVILSAAAKNVGTVHRSPTRRGRAIDHMRAILKKDIGALFKIQPVPGQRFRLKAPRRKHVWTSEELLLQKVAAAHEAKAKADVKRQKKATAASKRRLREEKHRLSDLGKEWDLCRGPHEEDEEWPRWNAADPWLWCEGCDLFGLCADCCESHRDLLDSHEEECRQLHQAAGLPFPAPSIPPPAKKRKS